MTSSIPSLKKLTIHALRGSVGAFELPFEKGKKLTLIYGENGAGKSTICDALDFLGSGNVGSLDRPGLRSANKYWNSLGKRPEDICVTLETNTDSCSARLRRKDVAVDNLKACPKVVILRRGQILALIDAQPGERYEAIKGFIDVTGVETSEAALRTSIRDMRNLQDLSVARLAENEASITRFWESVGKPGASALAWVKEETQRDQTLSQKETKALEKLLQAHGQLTEFPERIKTAKVAAESAKTASESARLTAQQCAQSLSADAGEMVNLLQSAQHYLSRHSTTTVCPLCESTEKAHDLPQRITKRLEALSQLQKANAAKDAAEQKHRQATENLERIQIDLINQIQKFEETGAHSDLPASIPLPDSRAPRDVALLAKWLLDTAHFQESWQKEMVTRQDKVLFTKNLKTTCLACEQSRKECKNYEILIPKLERVLKIIEEERRKFSDEILIKISKEVARIYEAVHPGEGLNKINLELDSKKRASLDIAASFCEEEEIPPQAYFSESHLDTLGLCIFLALAEMDTPETKILILDDVLASVDEQHVDRIVDMLYAEAEKFHHCIITTHYRPWKEKYRWGMLKNGQCQFVELAKWNRQKGMALNQSVPNVEQLKNLIEAKTPDTQLICAKAGVFLEATLDFITQLYQCKVPRKSDYTLGDLLLAIDKKLRNALIVDIKEISPDGNSSYKTVPLAPILEELSHIAQVRNILGCHFNTLSFELLDTDALQFGRKVLELMEAISDPEAGLPKSDKSGSYWATKGETRRLHPLKQPH